jgi:Trk K+ transport system NAD-binding subunit
MFGILTPISTINDINNTIARIENASRQDVKTKIGDSFQYIIYAIENKYLKAIKQKLISELSRDGATEIMPRKHERQLEK